MMPEQMTQRLSFYRYVMIFFPIFTLWGIIKPVALSMVNVWYHDVTFNHCFFVLPVFAWLIYRKRHILESLNLKTEYFALPVFFIFGYMTFLFEWAGINLLTHLSLILCIQSAIFICCGRYICKKIIFPILFLLFMVPFGTEFIMPLQKFTGITSVWLLSHSGVDVVLNGIQISTDRISFYVAEACAGLRFLIANIFIMCIYAHLTFKTKRSWLIFIPLSIFIPIIGNILRVYTIMLAGYYSNGTLAVGIDHILYGWGFFAVLAFGNFIIGEKLAKNERVVPCVSPPDSVHIPDKHKFWIIECSSTILFLGGSLLVLFLIRPQEPVTHNNPNIVPQYVTLYTPDNIRNVLHSPKWHTAPVRPFSFTGYNPSGGFMHKNNQAFAGVLHYAMQNPNNDITRADCRFYDEENWLLLGRKKISFMNIPWTAELSGKHGGKQRIIFHSLYMGHHYTNSVLNFKINMIKSYYTTGRTTSGVLYFMSDLPPDINDMDSAIAFLQKKILE